MNENNQEVLSPPPHVRGMKKLDRESFQKKVQIPSINVPAERTNDVIRALKRYFFKAPHLQPVLDACDSKTILLNPNLVDKDTTSIQEILRTFDLKLQCTEVDLSYENYTHNAILKAILPEDLQCNVTSFSLIGHIIHLNIKDQIKDYKTIIAEVLLDKQMLAKTIVNKAKTIDGTFRNFEMEVLAGEENFKVCVKENGLKYEFDFSKVFWNPRLSNEHNEITKQLQSGSIVFDVFAGVGPFAIPAAKKKCEVYANDLNPDSYKWLCHNANLNKVDSFITCFNLDGSDFITTSVKDKLTEIYESGQNSEIYVLMNLPASAMEFIKFFESLLDDDLYGENIKMPIIYCYFFSAKDDVEDTVINQYLNKDLQKCIKDKVIVRNVAPNKNMIRLVFVLPRSFLFKTSCTDFDQKSKRIKLDV